MKFPTFMDLAHQGCDIEILDTVENTVQITVRKGDWVYRNIFHRNDLLDTQKISIMLLEDTIVNDVLERFKEDHKVKL